MKLRHPNCRFLCFWTSIVEIGICLLKIVTLGFFIFEFEHAYNLWIMDRIIYLRRQKSKPGFLIFKIQQIRPKNRMRTWLFAWKLLGIQLIRVFTLNFVSPLFRMVDWKTRLKWWWEFVLGALDSVIEITSFTFLRGRF